EPAPEPPAPVKPEPVAPEKAEPIPEKTEPAPAKTEPAPTKAEPAPALAAVATPEDPTALAVKALLAEAKKDLEAKRLAPPPEGRNALDRYRQVLALTPDNAEAKQGVEGIARRLLAQAEYQLHKKNHPDKAAEYLEKAAKAAPELPEILALQKSLEEKKLALAAAPQEEKAVAAEVKGGKKGKGAKAVEGKGAAPNGSPKAGDQWTEPLTGLNFVWVPGGCFAMGSTFQPRSDETPDTLPVHEVCVDGVWMGQHEVSNRVFRLFRPTHKSWSLTAFYNDFNTDDQPAVMVSWEDAYAFIFWLHDKGGNGTKFRLPTEAEWEYACRSGGKEQPFAGGDAKALPGLGWFRDNSDASTHPVGSKAANGLGLHDMSGNAGEWTLDAYDIRGYEQHARQNPVHKPAVVVSRVIRGGDYEGWADKLRCTTRYQSPQVFQSSALGFRLVRLP
ncbi:MAG: SUMF1/EgtB/PvdO family nonheme iron enzyme, partial [Magnetococcales bacterium]|nr:SUMF1/EgtB/PvdO family nonheme iron enzyme [Magnetococcales bacterium]